jgi:tripartite-type tricarboxylate transporter receptor subunit TctC
MLSSGSLTILDPLMKKSLPYDTQRDLVPLCSVASVEQVLYLTSAQPFKTAAEFVAAAKEQPGKYTYAYASAFGRMNGELFQQASGVKLTSVPYRSTATGLTDVAAGRVDAFFADHVSAAPYVDSGKIRPLTVAGSKPFLFLPGVSPAAAIGIPGFDSTPTFSLYASSKVPKPTIDRLRELLAQVAKSDAWAAVIAKRQLGEFAVCGDELVRYHAKEVQRMRTVILDAGIEPQ